jgi:hypothetical protein
MDVVVKLKGRLLAASAGETRIGTNISFFVA